MTRTGLLRSLPLRGRLALIAALTVAVGIAAAAAVAYLATERTLRQQVDRGLLAAPLADGTSRDAPAAPVPSLPGQSINPEDLCSRGVAFGAGGRSVAGSLQLIRDDGTTCGPEGTSLVEPRQDDVAAARGGSTTAIRDDLTQDGRAVRVRTRPIGDGFAIMLVRDLDEVNRTLHSLAVALLAASGLGVGLAASAGWTIARAGLRPLVTFAGTVEEIAETQRLDVVIQREGNDEVARLAAAFNRMTASLAAARQRQQQLVVDASHELRTPLTSLRTNIELLMRSEASGRHLSSPDRRELLRSVDAQVRELAELVAELTQLAHDETAPASDVRLDQIVSRAVARASRRGDGTIDCDVEPWTVRGDAAALERAVVNVLDNAIKFSPPGSPIGVTLSDGCLRVRDRGVGLMPGEAPHVFDRFWRSPAARALPGSGLGLAIVADVVERHGGRATASPREDGGTVIEIRLPGSRPKTADGGGDESASIGTLPPHPQPSAHRR